MDTKVTYRFDPVDLEQMRLEEIARAKRTPP